jgi:hypothetical protein
MPGKVKKKNLLFFYLFAITFYWRTISYILKERNSHCTCGLLYIICLLLNFNPLLGTLLGVLFGAYSTTSIQSRGLWEWVALKFRARFILMSLALRGDQSPLARLGDIPDQSVSADSFQGSGTDGNGTFQSFLSELIPVDSHYFAKTSINYTIKRLKTII